MIILILLAFFGLTYLIKDAEILDRPRNWIISKSVFMYKMLDCSFCTGFHAGYIMYFIYNPIQVWNIYDLIVWALASASASLIIYSIANKINTSS